jgi:hypothetical protein
MPAPVLASAHLPLSRRARMRGIVIAAKTMTIRITIITSINVNARNRDTILSPDEQNSSPLFGKNMTQDNHFLLVF